MNVADLLAESARENPDRDAIVWPGRFGSWKRISYRALDAEVDGYASALVTQGIRQGEHVLVLVPAGKPLISLTYALFRAGAVPVLIDPGVGLDAFLRCVQTVSATTLIGIGKAHLARERYPAPFSSIERAFLVGNSWLDMLGRRFAKHLVPDPNLNENAQRRRELRIDAPAAVLFTSGSTGEAKGACYSVGTFFAQKNALQEFYGFAPGEVDLAAFPLFSLFDAAFGMTSVIPDIDPSKPAQCNPESIARAIEMHRATSAFGSPAIWTRVTPWAQSKQKKFPTLKRVLMAGAPVAPKLVRATRTILGADAEIHTPYGATESLPLSTIAGREIEMHLPRIVAGGGTCVGKPGTHVAIRVIEITDEPIASIEEAHDVPVGAAGEIIARGGVVTQAYRNRDDATRASKIADPSGDGSLWHRTGDLGYFDDEGWLWFCGRKTERVITDSGVICTDVVESRFSLDRKFGRVAFVGLGDPPKQTGVLVIEGPENATLAAEARKRTADLGCRIAFLANFPVDRRHNAKIHRREIAATLAAASGSSANG